MEGTNQTVVTEYKLSWVAFIRPVIFTAVLIVIGVALGDGEFKSVGAALRWFAIAYFGLKFYSLLSVSLILNDNGVWVKSGIFPWTKGVYGVTWRDVADANYRLGFFAWLFRCPTVCVQNRFNQRTEIRLPNLHNGRQAVETINAIMYQRFHDVA